MTFRSQRPRRLRRNGLVRSLVRETALSADDLVMPFFVSPGRRVRRKIKTMPGVCRLSVDELVKDVRRARDSGVKAVILFGVPDKKDPEATGAYDENGVVPAAVREVKKRVKGVLVATDVCLCSYTDHGHCGVVHKRNQSFVVDNDASVELLARTALVHARAGADIVAPSDMMDGRVGAIREALEADGLTDTIIMSYAAKFASAFYGPFRDAAECAPAFGDRATYQMDPANSDEALREVAADIDEGADIVMVKPALAYLDVIRRVKESFAVPLACYAVSGEYAIIKYAARAGALDEKEIVLETLLAMKRAGADIILTYHAVDAAKWLARLEA
jgi:porphobilinogen synthase